MASAMKSSSCASFSGGVLIFSNRLQFSRNLVNDITFETDIRGTAAPELRGW